MAQSSLRVSEASGRVVAAAITKGTSHVAVRAKPGSIGSVALSLLVVVMVHGSARRTKSARSKSSVAAEVCLGCQHAVPLSKFVTLTVVLVASRRIVVAETCSGRANSVASKARADTGGGLV